MDGKQMKSRDAKIVLLGDSAVGKTSLVYRYVHGHFEAENPSTIGASFLTKRMTVADWQVKLQIWDTAGQERFRCMTPMYYRSAEAAILVYDITNEQTFASIKRWVDELKSNVGDGIVLAIAGNKVDLAPQRQVDAARAKEYADSIGAIMLETSAANNTGIGNLFEEIANRLISNQRVSPVRPPGVGGNGNTGGVVRLEPSGPTGTAAPSGGGCCG